MSHRSTPPAPRGRGAADNPPNRFERHHLTVLHDDAEPVESLDDDGRVVQTLVFTDRARSVINPVDSPDLGLRWSLNPYRGCEHGCVYCYARPTHETLGFSCGLDFETKIVAKRDAARRLHEALASPRWRGEPIMLSGVTDPYQPVERVLRITRACLDVMDRFDQPVAVITKGALVLRDIELLGAMARRGLARAAISLTTLEPDLARSMEPRAAAPHRRLQAIAALAHAGVPVTVMVAPVIPGLNDREIPALLRAAADAGASSAGYVLLRLPLQVKHLFLDWLARSRPHSASRIESLVRQTRAGRLYDATFGRRLRGQGPIAQAIEDLFHVSMERFGLTRPRLVPEAPPNRRPTQPTLFDLHPADGA